MTDFPLLPPGHDPGPQSLRNRLGVPLLWWVVGLVGFAMFVAGVALVAHIRQRFPWRDEAIGGSIFGGIGLLCTWVAYSQYRKFRPPRLHTRMRGMSLAVDRDDTRRGETISVTIDQTATTKDLEVGLVCVELFDLRVTATTRAGIVYIRETNQKNAYEQWQSVEPPAGEQVLKFEIPEGAPCSYEGDCLSYAWRVSARLVRRLRSDPRIDHPVWVGP